MIIEINGKDEYVSNADDALRIIEDISPDLAEYIKDELDDREEKIRNLQDTLEEIHSMSSDYY